MAVAGKAADERPDSVEDLKANKAGSKETAPSFDGVETMVLEKDIFGNPYLPGAEVTVIKEIYMKAHSYEANKVEHARLTKLLVADKKDLAGLSVKYRQFFEGTKDGLHFLYPCAGINVKVDRKEQVSTEAESSAKSKKGKKGKKGDTPADIY